MNANTACIPMLRCDVLTDMMKLVPTCVSYSMAVCLYASAKTEKINADIQKTYDSRESILT